MSKVTWYRTKAEKVEARSFITSIGDVVDSDWMVDDDGISTVLNDGIVNVSLLLKTLGRSGKVMAQRDAESRDLTKAYLKKYMSIQESEPKILIDQVEIKDADHPLPLLTTRQKLFAGDEITVDQVFDSVSRIPNFDSNDLVIGTNGISSEFQFLFGEDIPVKNTTVAGDILNQGLFFTQNGGTYTSLGVNRLVCTNGLVTAFEPFKNQSFDRNQMDTQITRLSNWFTSLTTRKVESVRKLAVVTKSYPASALKHYWEDWSKRVELNMLTYFDVINDLTNFANASLSSTRYECIRASEIVRDRLDATTCITCGANL